MSTRRDFIKQLLAASGVSGCRQRFLASAHRARYSTVKTTSRARSFHNQNPSLARGEPGGVISDST